MNLSGKLGSRPSTSAPSAPPRPARPEPTAKVTLNTWLTLMPRPAATRIVHRRAQPAAEARAREDELQDRRQHRADDHDEEPVAADAHAADLEAALQELGQLDDLLLRADQPVDRRHRHEHQADGEQHVVEVRPLVHRPVQRALGHRPTTAGSMKASGSVARKGTPARSISSTVT